MTNREFYVAVIDSCTNAEVVDHARTALAKMEIDAEKNRAKNGEKTNSEYAPIIAKIVEFLSAQDGVQLTTVVAEAVGVSSSKASAALRMMVSQGKAEAFDVPVKGKGKQKAYKLI